MTLDTNMLILAGKQWHLVHRRQLRDLGMSSRQIDRRVERGLLRPVHRALYRVAGAPSSTEARIYAPILAANGVAAASHGTGARLLGVRGYESHRGIDISVERKVNLRFKGAALHRSHVLEPIDVVTTQSGIPVTRPERTIITAAAQRPANAGLLIERSILQGLTTHDRLWHYLSRYSGPGCPGSRVTRQALMKRDPRDRPPESTLEEEWIRTLAAYGVTGLVRQHPVDTEDGEKRIDLSRPELMIGLEIDSRLWHSTEDDYRRERRKRYLLAKAGFRIFPVTEFDRHERVAEIANDLLEAIDAAERRAGGEC